MKLKAGAYRVVRVGSDNDKQNIAQGFRVLHGI